MSNSTLQGCSKFKVLLQLLIETRSLESVIFRSWTFLNNTIFSNGIPQIRTQNMISIINVICTVSTKNIRTGNFL